MTTVFEPKSTSIVDHIIEKTYDKETAPTLKEYLEYEYKKRKTEGQEVGKDNTR